MICILCYGLYISSLKVSLLGTVACDTITLAMWSLAVMYFTDFGCFFIALTKVWPSTVATLDRPVWCLLHSTPLISFFFHDFPNGLTSCAQCLCNGSDRFPLYSELQSGLLFSHWHLSCLHVRLRARHFSQVKQAKNKNKNWQTSYHISIDKYCVLFCQYIQLWMCVQDTIQLNSNNVFMRNDRKWETS